jgi:hypothetical protein
MRFDNLYEMREMIETFAIRKFCRGGAPAIDLIRLLDALDAIWQVPLDERFTDGREVATLLSMATASTKRMSNMPSSCVRFVPAVRTKQSPAPRVTSA